ncbi:carboxylating nicotinate-nucleotide diphosphorylase [Oscillatoria salina]|uniref:carboxylating nicotinate-nucleotide diphosphorylase n=1 Tax=Oscillatoria salina TaxID=331517 RepID=UPI0013BA10B5|nr:carboxylating nicotinate-nucleotide diphosphorylase [Oscillatoria salina]MBZ8182558.1 carboxylating nicotinate-nucleotide diphosphorylase [Oscillatoria salina IIICB1]NET90588.1 carboxylating nicotinate-nucleotide diphosphorylase [Kamptonema sp. SIO1D9]
MKRIATLPPALVLDPLVQSWLLEDIGRGDRTTQGLLQQQDIPVAKADWVAKAAGTIAGLPVAARVFNLLSEDVSFVPIVEEGQNCELGQVIARLHGPIDALLMGERVALNLTMRMSGIATLTSEYVEKIADLPTKLVDTRKTTPGLRILEKYATQLGGALNHRLGLDDAVMIKDNHIQAAGGIKEAIAKIRASIPYPLSIEVETTTLAEVEEALKQDADIIMLDNMSCELMYRAVELIRDANLQVKIEASGNITLENLREVAQTGVDYISTSAPITRSSWLDLSMKFNSGDDRA